MDAAGTSNTTGADVDASVSSRRRSMHPLVWPLVAVMLVLAAVLIASSSGAVRVWSEPPPGRPQRVEPIVADEPVDAVEVGEQLAPPRDGNDGWFMRIVALVVGLVLLRVAYMVVVGWWAILRNWRLEREHAATSSFDVLPNPGQPLSVTLDEMAQVEALRSGAPRNAIVACWMRLEDDVAAAGLVPHASETSAELTERVLGAALADRGAVLELADRYREARFSEHPIGERERGLALDALGRIHASLRLPRPAP